MDLATYPLSVVKVYEELLRKGGEWMVIPTLQDSAEAPSTITERDFVRLCSYCGKLNNPGDSFTMTRDGKILRCEHYHLVKEDA